MDSSEVLPSSLRYNTPPTLPQARSYSFQQSATEDRIPVTAGQTIQIDIPRLQRSYLEKTSRLQFKLNVDCSSDAQNFINDIDTVCLDTPGAYSLIDVIEVYDYLGSTLLERIEGVAQLMALIMDTVPTDHPLSYTNEQSLGTFKGSILEKGFSYDAVGATDPSALIKILDKVEGPISGRILNVRNANASGAPLNYYTFSIDCSIPLYSFLGLLSEKLVPLHNGFTLILKLNAMEQSLGITTPGNLSTNGSNPLAINDANLHDVVFNMDILELGPTAESLVLSANGEGPLVVHTKSYRHYSREEDGQPSTLSGDANTILDTASERTYLWPINLNASSVTSVLWFMRPQYTQNKIAMRSISHRIRNNLVSWSLKYGSSTLPQSSGINCSANNYPNPANFANATFRSSGSNCYSHLLKARRVSSSPVITEAAYNHNGYDTRMISSATTGTASFADIMYSLIPTGYSIFYKSATLANQFPRFATPPIGRFACGLNTSLVSTNTISGLNTNGMATSIEARFVPPLLSSIQTSVSTDKSKYLFLTETGSVSILNMIVDIYVEYDSFISILPNISTNVSF